jgi:transcriptional regulator with XRE-family HTH domain
MEASTRRFVYDPNSPSQRRATANARADEEFLARLVRLRRELGMTQADVARLLGISQASVSEFERADNDPKYSTVRRYAHAIGVNISHAADVDDAQWGPVATERLNCDEPLPLRG